MQDDALKRGIHFVCGAVVGGLLGAYLVPWVGRGAKFDDPTPLVVAGAVGGALILGVVAAWQLDRFWGGLRDWLHAWF